MNRIFLSTILIVSSLCVSAQVDILLLDETGAPMVGVNAYTDDFSFSASSDAFGRLQVPELDLKDTVRFSFIGYEPLSISYLTLTWKATKVPAGRPVVLELSPTAQELEAAVVVGRTDVVAEEIPWTVAMITSKDIAASNPQTSAEALENSGEVFVQRSQMGGGSPILRGFEANSILLVVDGVRMNNAISRSGHLQAAITVDPAMLDRAEVIYGAGSLLYGSDALGGVIHFRSKEPRLAFDGAERNSGNYFVRFSSANLEKTAHLDYNVGRKKWASQTSLSVSSFSDLRAGTKYNHEYTDFGQVPFYVADATTGEVRSNIDPFLQRGTGYDQIDLMQKVKWQLGDERYILANLQYSNSSEVPRFDQLTVVAGDRASDLRFSEWYYGPQRRVLSSLRFVSSNKNVFHDRAQWIAAYQRVDEDRYDRRLDNMWRNFALVDVDVYSLNFDADKYIGKSTQHHFSYGFEGQYNTVASLGGRVNLLNESVLLDQISRYPSGGSEMTSTGAYTTYRYSTANDRFHGQAGVRFSRIDLASKFGNDQMTEPVDWPQALRDGIKTSNQALTYAAGFTVSATKSTTVQVLGSTAFRAPNIDDFGKMRVKGGQVLTPNVDITPEQAVNAELTLTQNLGQLGSAGFAARLSATGFMSEVDDILVRVNGALPNGDSTFMSGGDEYQVQILTNADKGTIRGAGLRADVSYGKDFDLAARLTFTKGRAVNAEGEESPLAHIPPTYGQVMANYRMGKFGLSGLYRFNGAKLWEDYAPAGSPDNEDLAIPDVGTPFWSIIDFSVDARLSKSLNLQGSVENILDLHYRPFASGVSAPGRNFVISLRGSF